MFDFRTEIRMKFVVLSNWLNNFENQILTKFDFKVIEPIGHLGQKYSKGCLAGIIPADGM